MPIGRHTSKARVTLMYPFAALAYTTWQVNSWLQTTPQEKYLYQRNV